MLYKKLHIVLPQCVQVVAFRFLHHIIKIEKDERSAESVLKYQFSFPCKVTWNKQKVLAAGYEGVCPYQIRNHLKYANFPSLATLLFNISGQTPPLYLFCPPPHKKAFPLLLLSQVWPRGVFVYYIINNYFKITFGWIINDSKSSSAKEHNNLKAFT